MHHKSFSLISVLEATHSAKPSVSRQQLKQSPRRKKTAVWLIQDGFAQDPLDLNGSKWKI
jgi:hypothetical protein